jgi:hypothetical protein
MDMKEMLGMVAEAGGPKIETKDSYTYKGDYKELSWDELTQQFVKSLAEIYKRGGDVLLDDGMCAIRVPKTAEDVGEQLGVPKGADGTYQTLQVDDEED